MLAVVVAVVLRLAITVALAPPHPDYIEWEPVGKYRAQRNVSYDYHTRHISNEHCRHLSESDCQYEDEMAGNALVERRVATNQGDVKVLVLLCRFKDHADHDLPSREYFDELFNGSQGEINPVGSIREWLLYASMGRYRVTFDVQDWYTVPFTEAEFSDGKRGLVGAVPAQELFAEKLSELYVSGYNFFELDSEGWGTLDGLAAIHSGYGSEFGNRKNNNCTNHNSNRTWSQGYSYTARGWDSPDYSYTVSHFMIAGAWDPPLCSGKPAGMAVITHEYMHQFGLHDLYDNDADEKGLTIGGIGKFCLMSSVYGWTGDLSIPGHMSAYSRSLVGWIEPFEITQDGFYPIQAAEFSSQVYVIKSPFPEGESLLIENRQPVKWDKDWPGGGIVLYHIDESAPRQSQRGFPGHPDFPEHHYRAAVLAADGNYSIERGTSDGDIGDFWVKDMTLSSSTEVWPNSASYRNGDVRATGVEITVRSGPGFIMMFEVSGLGPGRASAHKDGYIGIESTENPDTTGKLISWIVTMLGGIATMLGILLVVL